MNCESCKKTIKTKSGYKKHLETDLHKRMSNPRFCVTCNIKIDSNEPFYVLRCKPCYYEDNKPSYFKGQKKKEILSVTTDILSVTTDILSVTTDILSVTTDI